VNRSVLYWLNDAKAAVLYDACEGSWTRIRTCGDAVRRMARATSQQSAGRIQAAALRPRLIMPRNHGQHTELALLMRAIPDMSS
jgi:hypothetical protein